MVIRLLQVSTMILHVSISARAYSNHPLKLGCYHHYCFHHPYLHSTELSEPTTLLFLSWDRLERNELFSAEI
jgi:hypothetical protein